jgi:hypothetical protein
MLDKGVTTDYRHLRIPVSGKAYGLEKEGISRATDSSLSDLPVPRITCVLCSAPSWETRDAGTHFLGSLRATAFIIDANPRDRPSKNAVLLTPANVGKLVEPPLHGGGKGFDSPRLHDFGRFIF